MSQPRLFLVVADEKIELPTPPAKLSAQRRRTLRQRAFLAAGVHPATGGRLGPEDETCGTCAHRVVVEHGYRRLRWHKCELVSLSHCATSDIRVGWPACASWERRAQGASG